MRRSISILFLAVLSLLAVPVHAADDVKDSKLEQTATDEIEERNESEIQPVLSKENVSVKGLKAEPVEGMIRARLEGRFQHALVLRVNPDGTRAVECVDEPARIEKLMAAEKDDASADSGRPEGTNR